MRTTKAKVVSPPARKKAVAYLRCSDPKQETSVEDQRTAVTAYAKDNDYQLVDEYVDFGISGDDTLKRISFLQMLGDVESGKFEFVLFWDAKRFGRFHSIEAGYYIFPYMRAGVTLVPIDKGPIDWDSHLVRLLFFIEQDSFHEHLHSLSKDVLRGQLEAAKKGSWIGAVPYGYALVGKPKEKKLVLGDARRVRVVKRIFTEFTQQGRSLSDIADRLTRDGVPTARGTNKWRYDAVRGILANEVYTGLYRFNKNSRAKYNHLRNGVITKGARKGANDPSDMIEIPDNHEALVTKKAFAQAQVIIAKGKNGRSRYTPETNPYLLSHLLRCGHCEAPLWGTKNQKRRKFECSRQQDGCKGMVVYETDVLDWLSAYVEEEFISDKQQTALLEKAKRGELTERDLPEGFARLKRLLVGRQERRVNPKTVDQQVDRIDTTLKKLRRNLIHIENVKNIAAAEEEIATFEKEREELVATIKNQPTEQDINRVAIDLLQKLFMLATLTPERMKPVLREIEYIKVFTRCHGEGRGKRYEFDHGEVKFNVPVNTSKLNLHNLVQSQAAYR